MTSSRVGHKVLVLAGDPLLAALLGALVEIARLEAAFAQPGESTDEALKRVKPIAAILLDGQHAEAENDLLIARARKRDIALMMFGTSGIVQLRRAWAERQRVAMFELPGQLGALGEELHRLRDLDGTQRLATRRAHTERDQDGTLIFDDGKGTRWSVYDRRANDRRGSTVDRRFVNERGGVLHCDVSEEEAGSLSVATLAGQLARATALAE